MFSTETFNIFNGFIYSVVKVTQPKNIAAKEDRNNKTVVYLIDILKGVQGWHRAPTSHQFGLGLSPRVDTICGLSSLLVLSSASRGFYPGIPGGLGGGGGGEEIPYEQMFLSCMTFSVYEVIYMACLLKHQLSDNKPRKRLCKC